MAVKDAVLSVTVALTSLALWAALIYGWGELLSVVVFESRGVDGLLP